MGMMDTSTKFEYRGTKKKIVVLACKHCPKLRLKWNDEEQGYTDYVCRVPNKTVDSDKVIANLSEIPEWCPLPDDA